MGDMVYRVILHDRDYDFNKIDDSITSCRQWAKASFPRERVSVSRVSRGRACEYCLSIPCCCMLRGNDEA